MKAEAAAPPDAAASDPAKLQWMVGAPPPPDRIVRFEDGSYYQFPALRWSVSNFRQLMPTVNVSRGLGAPVVLPRALQPGIDDVTFTPIGATKPMTWADSLAANYTDGILILHRGQVVYERYFGVLKDDGQHAAMSITKSFTGTLGAMLVADGTLDGQRIYIDPRAEMVIVRYASHPVASKAANDPTTLPAFDAVADYLQSQHR